ncbi:unnamed protein product [Coregonus sp. 'balchen']|nr:unnamed protein product [Coregonus sp. 'balchen']
MYNRKTTSNTSARGRPWGRTSWLKRRGAKRLWNVLVWSGRDCPRLVPGSTSYC